MTDHPQQDVERLCERLRKTTHDHMTLCEPWLINPDGPAAADLLTQQAATIAELRAQVARP